MQRHQSHRPLRLMYAAGPGDIIGTFRHWREGRDDPTQVSMTYSGQFFDVCRELEANGYAIASHPRREVVQDGQFRVEHRPIWFARRPSAALYHFGQLCSALRMMLIALHWRADVLIICDGTCHWFPLRLLPKLGVRVVPGLFCVLWRKYAPPRGRVKRLINWLDLPFWRRSATVVLSMSSDITRQLDQLTHREHVPVIQFLPTYRHGTFDADSAPPPRDPFRVLFAGRIEANKGVFDLLEIARRLNQGAHTEREAPRLGQIEFELCGNGSMIDQLHSRVRDAGLCATFRVHGHCDRHQMRQMFRQCHAVIVPTTTDFIEGFNQVVVEGVLSGRPVITSDVCPALEYVREAVVQVPADDLAAYHDAILKLLQDRDYYEQKRQACRGLQAQFYDLSRSWAAALGGMLESCFALTDKNQVVARLHRATPGA